MLRQRPGQAPWKAFHISGASSCLNEDDFLYLLLEPLGDRFDAPHAHFVSGFLALDVCILKCFSRLIFDRGVSSRGALAVFRVNRLCRRFSVSDPRAPPAPYSEKRSQTPASRPVPRSASRSLKGEGHGGARQIVHFLLKA